MSQLCCLLLAISTAASIILAVNASPATEALKKQRDDYRREAEKAKTETKSLTKKLEEVQREKLKLKEEYETNLQKITDARQRTLVELEQLVFKKKDLELVRQDKNQTAIYLNELSRRVAFARIIAEENVHIAERRRKEGVERTCIDYDASSFQKPSKRVRNKVASRFRDTEDTADILLLSAQRDDAKANLEAALQERDRVFQKLEAEKNLLNMKTSSWKADLDSTYNALKSNEEKVADVKELVKKLEEIIKKLDYQIKKLEEKIREDKEAWATANKQLTTIYKIGLSCYQALETKTHKHLNDYAQFQRSLKVTNRLGK